MNYQIAVNLKANPLMYEFVYDMSLEEVRQTIIRPYVSGNPVLINGKRIEQPEIGRLQVIETEHNSPYLLSNASQEVEREGYPSTHPMIRHFPSSMQDLYRDTYVSLRMMNRGKDVTNDLMRDATLSMSSESKVRQVRSQPGQDTNVVFVVHGRNEQARRAMFDFLRAIGLQPLEWSQAIKATGQPAPYIGEILDAAFSLAHAVIVLMTPDDEARLQEQYRQPNDLPHEVNLSGQARQNVLFEAGMAMGRDSNRTILVEIGRLRPFSDVAGRHIMRLDGTSQSRQLLAQRLQAAECPVNLDGTDWHSAGDFQSCLEVIEAEQSQVTANNQGQGQAVDDLIEDAATLLIEAADSVDGTISRLVLDHGFMIVAGGRNFCETGEPRSEARWRRALDELVVQYLVEDQYGNGTVYKVTHDGFLATNELKSRR